MKEFEVQTPWQAFIQIRQRHYQAMLDDPKILKENRWPHNLQVLYQARSAGCLTALATMSNCEQANFVLMTLQLVDAFDFVTARDDVRQGKPDPEMYTLVAEVLDVPAERCLVLEDSPPGVSAALAAGMWCIAEITPFTLQAMHESGLLESEWIVNDPEQGLPAVQTMLERRAGS
jgi:HAD superfamily hydrolase (TIGR01509 family)